MIQLTESLRVDSIRVPGTACLYTVWIEQNGNRVCECGVTEDPHALEARAARAVRAKYDLPDHTFAEVTGGVGVFVFCALVRVAALFGR